MIISMQEIKGEGRKQNTEAMISLRRLVRRGLPDRSFKLRLNNDKDCIPDWGYCKCKGPEAGKNLLVLRDWRNNSIAAVKRKKWEHGEKSSQKNNQEAHLLGLWIKEKIANFTLITVGSHWMALSMEVASSDFCFRKITLENSDLAPKGR